MVHQWSTRKALCAFVACLSLTSPAQATGTLEDQHDRVSNESLVWGPYRPNLYFGVRPRIPKSLLAGLLWANVDNFENVQANFRHTCEQNEGMAGYGWDEYDVRTGGKQTIHDAENHIDLTTEFVKIPGGSRGGGWGVRINGKLRHDAPPDTKTTVVFYVGNTGNGVLEVVNDFDTLGYLDNIKIAGQTEELGLFQLEVTRGPTKNVHPIHDHPSYDDRPLDRTFAQSAQVPENYIWQAKNILFGQIKKELDIHTARFGENNLPPPFQALTLANSETGPGANFHMVQKVFQGPFEFDVLFSSESAGQSLTSSDLDREIKATSNKFSSRFKDVFKAQKPFSGPKYDVFSKTLFSNLLGGIGYFYGDQVVDRSGAVEYDEDEEFFWEGAAEAIARKQATPEGPYELFTAIPSRPFFPRGFLWDEGFHLLPIIDWDTGLTLEIIRSWFNLIDEDGWIAREQILGDEARSKVPPEFQIQYPHYANPPTLFLIVELLAEKLASSSLSAVEQESYSSVLNDIYPLLKRHYFWYRRTQHGDLKTYDHEAYSSKEGYRWRGRTPSHILTSGQDDFPRAQPPHPGELHVDLISWMGMMTRSLKRIASVLSQSADAAELAGYEDAIVRNVEDLHWDEAEQTYCDCTIDDYEESVHACHKGYVSIFPFLTGLLPPNSPRLGAILDLIADPVHLWSSYGIRSLSKQDALYATGENYWRSPIWINMNYLVLTNLLKIAEVPGKHQVRATDLYNRLRVNLVNTVYNSWKTTGFAWEQYNPDSGDGQRTQHFTGWTSLVVKIMCMPDLSGAVNHGEL